MTFTDIQPYLALLLGAIGTLLGVVNLIRDIKKGREKISVRAVPVLRKTLEVEQQRSFRAVVSDLQMQTTENTWRNFGLKTKQALQERLDSGEIPNLIGFEVNNHSSHSVFIHSLGLSNKEGKSTYEGDHLDAIQELKAERTEGDPIEVKPKALFTTYLYIDDLVGNLLLNGYIYPVVESTSKRKRIHGSSRLLKIFSDWIKMRVSGDEI